MKILGWQAKKICLTLILTITLSIWLNGGVKAETIRIDLRKAPIFKAEYAITFAAIGGEPGHAFVVLNAGDEHRKRTTNEAVGFYPDAYSKTIKALFGKVGTFGAEQSEKAEKRIIFLVDRKIFIAAKSVLSRWRHGKRYILGISDCTTFVSEVAKAMNLERPSRLLFPYPIDYVTELGALNQFRNSNSHRGPNPIISSPMPIIDMETLLPGFAAAQAEEARSRAEEEKKRISRERQKELLMQQQRKQRQDLENFVQDEARKYREKSDSMNRMSIQKADRDRADSFRREQERRAYWENRRLENERQRQHESDRILRESYQRELEYRRRRESRGGLTGGNTTVYGSTGSSSTDNIVPRSLP